MCGLSDDVRAYKDQQLEDIKKELKAYKGVLQSTQRAQKNLRILLWNVIKSFDKNFAPDKKLEEMTSQELHAVILAGLVQSKKHTDFKAQEASKYILQLLKPFSGLSRTYWPKGLEQLLNLFI